MKIITTKHVASYLSAKPQAGFTASDWRDVARIANVYYGLTHDNPAREHHDRQCRTWAIGRAIATIADARLQVRVLGL